MFLLLKAKLRLALRIPVCCFPILSPLDFLADVQDKMFLPLVPWQQSGFIRSFRGASNAILPRPGWWCPPSAVMLCTDLLLWSLFLWSLTPVIPVSVGWQVPTWISAVLYTRASAQPWWIWSLAAHGACSLQSSGTSYLKLMGKR